MPKTRPIVRAPIGTDEIEQIRVARVGQGGRRVASPRTGRNAVGDRLAGRKTAGGGSLSGGTYTGPVG